MSLLRRDFLYIETKFTFLKLIFDDTDTVKSLYTDTLYNSKILYKVSSIYTNEPRHKISNNVVCTTSKGSTQLAHMRSLIRAFASLLNILWQFSYWLNIIWSF